MGLEGAMEKLEPQDQAEIREWMTGEADRKRTLIDVIHERRQAEYNLLKNLALEEGAEKTAAAIDELIAKSNARYEHIVSRLDDEKRQARREQLKEKREQKREERLRKREDRREDSDRGTDRRSPSSSRRGEHGE